ncbi:MAG: sigma-70 family RNA polymerase sigma factor, partial [Verrucomicrobiales bacterium]|nr:sigma-70 family RNA polymerase sigma factor [Verrucomicrobiales bacterium]
MDPGLDTDIALMLRLAGGEDLALNDLISRWRDRLAAFLLRMVGDHATAMDLTQETFVRLYTSRKTYKPTAAFSTYLFHIATNLARTQARWRKRHPTVPMDDENREIRHEAVDS